MNGLNWTVVPDLPWYTLLVLPHYTDVDRRRIGHGPGSGWTDVESRGLSSSTEHSNRVEFLTGRL